MKIEVKTGGLLGKYLPQGSARNRAEMDVPQGATCEGVMQALGMPLDASYLTSLNGTILRQSDRAGHVLGEGDTLAIMPPLKGG